MNKKLMVLSLVLVSIAFLLSFAFTEEKRNSRFETLKSLEGDWVGEWAGNTSKDVKATFRLISGGTSVLQTVNDFHGEMVTTYYPDMNSLMATHYCNANNQPRLRSNPSATANVITFFYQDSTNMASAAEGHIEKLVITLQDSNHLRQDWTWKEGDATRTDTLSFKRSK